MILYTIDITYNGDDSERKLTTIEDPDFLKCISKTEELLERQKKMDPHIFDSRQIYKYFTFDIKYKILTTLNERRNHASLYTW